MLQKLLKGAIVLFILLNVFFTAPLRYFFTFVLGENYLNYLINVVFLVLIALRLQNKFATIVSRYLFIILYFGLLIAYSLLFESLKQIGFFIYLLLPCFFYALFISEVKNFIDNHLNLFVLLFVLSAAGIVFDYYYDYPWKSLTFTIGNNEVAFSRDWTTFGQERIAGLTRSSFDAAMSMILLLIILLSKIRNFFLTHILFVTTFFSVWLTTTKGCITSLLIIYVVYLLTIFEVAPWGRIVKSTITFMLLAILIILPIGLIKEIKVPVLSNESLVDRIDNTWPFLIGQFETIQHYLLGLGIGSVGTAQLLFSSVNTPNIGDNLFIYLYCNFGILSIFLIFILYFRFKNTDNILFIYVLLFTISYGLTTNIFESSVGLFLISICFFYPLGENSLSRPRVASYPKIETGFRTEY